MFDLLVQPGKPWRPTQHISRLVRIAYERWGVTRAGGTHFSPDRRRGDLFTRPHNLGNGKSLTVTEVKRSAGFTCREPFDGGNVRVREIADVHVVSHASAIFRRMVLPEDLNRRLTPHRRE